MKRISLGLLSLILAILCIFTVGCISKNRVDGDTDGSTEVTENKKDEVTEDMKPTLNPEDEDGKFTIAIIPDTQHEVNMEHAINQKYMQQRNEWILSKQKERDIRFVLHTGDLTNWGDAEESQLVLASNAMKVLDDANLPVVYSLGNHDTAAVGVGGGAAVPDKTKERVRDTSAFNKYFSTTRYPYMTTMEEGVIDNAYTFFEAGGLKWMVLTLELWPRAEVVEWADKVVKQYPDHNVILMTHCYIAIDGSISTSNGGYGANSPEYVYKNLVYPNDNIRLVFCGHVGTTNFRIDKNEKGNKVVSILGCFHSMDSNPVRLLEIDVKSGNLKGEVYTPINSDRVASRINVPGLKFIDAE